MDWCQRDGKPSHDVHCDLNTQRTSRKALLRLMRQRWAYWCAGAWRLRKPVAMAPRQPTQRGLRWVGISPTGTEWSDHQSALLMQRPKTTRMGEHKRWDCRVKRSHRSTSRHGWNPKSSQEQQGRRKQSPARPKPVPGSYVATSRRNDPRADRAQRPLNREAQEKQPIPRPKPPTRTQSTP